MLSYAFKVLNQKEYRKIEAENFENTAELLSEILIIGVSHQIKQGLVKDYRDVSETTSSVRGKINITESINSQTFIKKQLNCTYDEFSENCYLNQIIKSTMKLLLSQAVCARYAKHFSFSFLKNIPLSLSVLLSIFSFFLPLRFLLHSMDFFHVSQTS